MAEKKRLNLAQTWLPKLIIAVVLIVSMIQLSTNYFDFNLKPVPRPKISRMMLRPNPKYDHDIVENKMISKSKVTNLTETKKYQTKNAEILSKISKITSKSAHLLYEKKIKKMQGSFYEVKTLQTGPVSYDKAETFPKIIQGNPRWEPETYNEFNYWLPQSKFYVGFGTWIGVTLLFSAQLVEKAIGFEGDPAAYASVHTHLEGNSHRSWYKHTHVYPVAVRAGEDSEARQVSMNSDHEGNSCSGMKDVKTRKDNACGSNMNKVSWDIDGYTLPYLLKVNEIPASKETFIKIDVESYECELIPSWLDWLRNMTDKPTLLIAFHGGNVRCCSKEQYNKIISVSKLYKSVLYTKGNEAHIKTRAEDHFNTTYCTTSAIVFTDLY